MFLFYKVLSWFESRTLLVTWVMQISFNSSQIIISFYWGMCCDVDHTLYSIMIGSCSIWFYFWLRLGKFTICRKYLRFAFNFHKIVNQLTLSPSMFFINRLCPFSRSYNWVCNRRIRWFSVFLNRWSILYAFIRIV